MRANNRPLCVIGKPTNKALREVPYGLNLSDHSIAEAKGLYTAVTNISLCLRGGHLEGELVSALEEKHFEMLDLCVGKQHNIVTEELLWFGRGYGHVESGV